MLLYQGFCLGFQALDLRFDLHDALADLLEDELGCGVGARKSVQSILGLGPLSAQAGQQAGTAAQGQNLRRGAAPGFKGHVSSKVTQQHGIDSVRFGATHACLGIAFAGFGIDHHDLQTFGLIQRDGQVQVIDACGL